MFGNNINRVKRIIGEYDENIDSYKKAELIASEIISASVDDASIMKIDVISRIKERNSLRKKIEKNIDKYSSIADITDILGFRIICYFVDDIERISAVIEDIFDIDYDNSIDKRKMLNPNAFGYLSVHYVCSLKRSSAHSESLCGLKFEIQIRTLLQHVWAEIEHDLGYKSEFAIPRAVRRDFSRVAGLLELADEKFADIKNGLDGYTEHVKKQIAINDVDDIYIDKISFNEYVFNNVLFKAYCDKFSKECGVEITMISPELYLSHLTWLNINTLAEFDDAINKSGDCAIDLMKRRLSDFELDIVTSNVVIRSLCYAELIRRDYNKSEIMEFLLISSAKEDADRISGKLLDYKQQLF